MAFRRFFKLVLTNPTPILYTAATSIIVNCSGTNDAQTNEKIQWERPDFSKFTYEHMIKQSTIDSINTVSQALTITYTAIETTSEEYRRSLALLMSLIRETLAYRVADSHWDLIIAARSEVQKNKQLLTQLLAYMDYVQKMAIAATEASYMAGMDNLSMSLSQRMDDALNNMNREVNHNGILEAEYNVLQEECIITSNSDRKSKNGADEDVKVKTVFVD